MSYNEHYPMQNSSLSARKAQVFKYLGKNVDVIIDRPIGAVHSKHSDMIYPINYGYIENEIAPDGEGLDVYILGETKPLKTFSGKIIGIIHRENDIEDKLVAAADGIKYNQAQIEQLTHFQEKYYKTKVDSLYHKSAGMIVYRKNVENIEFLVIFQKKSKTWSFPKGHIEANETEKQTAVREVFEEIGMKLSPIDGFSAEVSYKIAPVYEKTVVLFLAQATGEISVQPDEVGEYRWVDMNTALNLLNHKDYEKILNDAQTFIFGRK